MRDVAPGAGLARRDFLRVGGMLAAGLSTMPLLEQEYITTGKVRLVYINLPLTSVHPNAQAAAQVALCAARQDRFWAMHDLLFRHQDQWAKLPKPAAFLLALGDSARLDRAALARCAAAKETAALVDADAARARRAGAVSTPSFYVEGGLLEGAAPVSPVAAHARGQARAVSGAR